MNTIKHTQMVRVPAEFLFDYSQRNSCRKEWDPFVSEVLLHDEHDLPSEGTEVTVRTWNHMSMTCRYIQFRRPDCIAIKMLEGPCMLASFGGTWRFESLGTGHTKVSFTYGFKLKPAFHWLSPFAKTYFSWDMRRRLGALRKHSELSYTHYKKKAIIPRTNPLTV